jgi:hypothetical protein
MWEREIPAKSHEDGLRVVIPAINPQFSTGFVDRNNLLHIDFIKCP